MAINGQTNAAIKALVTDQDTSEGQFMTGLDHIIDAADVYIDEITFSGGNVTGTVAVADNTATITATATASIGAGDVTTTTIANGAVTGEKIADDTISSAKFLENSVNSRAIGSADDDQQNHLRAITGDHIQLNTISPQKLTDTTGLQTKHGVYRIEPVANGDPVASDFAGNVTLILQY